MTVRIPCPRCGYVQAVNLKTDPARMWPHGYCVRVYVSASDLVKAV